MSSWSRRGLTRWRRMICPLCRSSLSAWFWPPFFDFTWMFGLNIGCVAVLPQLWMVSRNGGKVETLTSHFMMAMAVSRLLSGMFMWHARFDITCDEWITGYSHAIWAILAAHALNLMLLGDFGYYYLKAVFSQGLFCQM